MACPASSTVSFSELDLCPGDPTDRSRRSAWEEAFIPRASTAEKDAKPLASSLYPLTHDSRKPPFLHRRGFHERSGQKTCHYPLLLRIFLGRDHLAKDFTLFRASQVRQRTRCTLHVRPLSRD